ncbi:MULTISPECIES: hypothetical protein [Streptomyces]|uniref:hypothetical protein n=1 Tax=Streptomyces TaxID=1883 RepID=UPI001011A96E|nr:MULTISPECIES: hypothetical protein [unclassified Streptomyces]MDT0420537.1 hypothetical protein [Streptomyces sp. DSM 41859]
MTLRLVHERPPESPESDLPCRLCDRLRAEERAATVAGDHSRAVDCRVLIARHPHGFTRR